MATRIDTLQHQGVAFLEPGQVDLAILELGVGVVGSFDIGTQITGERDHLPAGGELYLSPSVLLGHASDPDLHALANGVGHL